MLDLKGVLRVVIVQGLQDFGYGVQSVESIAPTTEQNTVYVMRSGAQQEDDRTLITLRRVGAPRSSSFYLGNMADPQASIGGFGVPLIMVEDRVQVKVEAFHDSGGQSLVDKLMLQIPTMFVQSWDAMTFPTEVGGYGLLTPTWTGGGDTVTTTHTGGKVSYSNHFDFSAVLPADAASNDPSQGTITAIVIQPTLANAADNGNSSYTLSITE